MIETTSTDFGFERVSPGEKTRRVSAIFSSVASNYDLMNDLMSFGAHRLWKRYAVHISQVKRGDRVLDVAGGTGDVAALYRWAVGTEGRVIVCDVNAKMLEAGRNRMLDKGLAKGIEYIQADAECLPFNDNIFDCISIAFGLRNVTDKNRALDSIREKLKYGGCVVILEFSRVILPLLKRLYDNYSFKVIPLLGKLVARDRASYQYLVESIRMHPDQEELKEMMVSSGFSLVSCYNLSGGIVAIHKGYKL
ncbi:MAG: bifunctional demethylmenaquinone methyltransferase/2-methoxy-6-polyprenyl-1,4-benzoquinol methylase UbiE [Gammaproteobacteria bacterium]